MGVDWIACDVCGETFPDCGDFVNCSCNRSWCDHECAHEDGFVELDEDDYTEEEWEDLECEGKTKSCSFCRGEEVEDNDLLDFAMSVLGVTRNELLEDYKKTRM